LVACGTRTIIDATLGNDRIGETTYARDLLGVLRRGMIVLAERNFAAREFGSQVQLVQKQRQRSTEGPGARLGLGCDPRWWSC
jgi:hypothetical protein